MKKKKKKIEWMKSTWKRQQPKKESRKRKEIKKLKQKSKRKDNQKKKKPKEKKKKKETLQYCMGAFTWFELCTGAFWSKSFVMVFSSVLSSIQEENILVSLGRKYPSPTNSILPFSPTKYL